MTIEIHQPEIEALIQQRLQSGAFHDVEEVLLHALKTSQVPSSASGPQGQDEVSVAERRKRDGRKSLPEVFESIRGLLTDEEVDTLFARNRSSGRPVDFE